MIPQTNLQHIPKITDTYRSLPFLETLIEKHTSSESSRNKIIKDLLDYEKYDYARLEELSILAENNPPTMEPYNAYGHRIDKLITSAAWKDIHKVAVECHIPSLPYEKHHPDARLHWALKTMLFTSVSGMFSCPLAMTDGAARCLMDLRESKDESYHYYFDSVIDKLTSTDPDQHWTSGQWMTEYIGGSDVGESTRTVACERRIPEDRINDSKGAFFTHYLTGMKWFTSATDCNMALVLGREYDEKNQLIPGSKGLSLFYVELYTKDKKLNSGIKIIRLKNKLGTRQMPTAELELSGLPARRLGKKGSGIPLISRMMNITRVHNSVAAVSYMIRGYLLSINFNENRHAFGDMLINKSLQKRVLLSLEVDVRAMCTLVAFVVSYMNQQDPADKAFLRLMTPVMKLYTAKYVVHDIQETMEAIGGTAYLESSHFPNLLRDANVLPIWEGTTNVLSMDVLRVLLSKDGKTAIYHITDLLSKALTVLRQQQTEIHYDHEFDIHLKVLEKSINEDLHEILSLFMESQNVSNMEECMRYISFGIANCVTAYCLLDTYCYTRNQTDFDYYIRFIQSEGNFGLSNGRLVDIPSIRKTLSQQKRTAEVILTGQHRSKL